jgi:hypothetical protein
MLNEWIRPSVSLSIQPDGQFIHPVIRLFTATLNPSIYNNPRSVPSYSRTVFFLGGFVFVAVAVVTQTQHTEQPLIHPVIRPDCFFLGGSHTHIHTHKWNKICPKKFIHCAFFFWFANYIFDVFGVGDKITRCYLKLYKSSLKSKIKGVTQK